MSGTGTAGTTFVPSPAMPGKTSGPERPAKRRRKPLSPSQVGLYGLLGMAAIIALFPVLWLLSGSLQSIDELYGGQHFLPSAAQWSNYVDAWTQGHLGTYLANSILYTVVAVVGILIVASLSGYALSRLDFAGKGVFTVLILSVMIIPAPAMFIAQYKLMISLHLTNSRVGYILILITAGIPMATLIMRSFFANQPKELEEAAAIDGASPLRTFWSVILPLARPGLAAVAVVQGLNVWNEYLMALVLFDSDNLMPIQRGLTSFVSAETPQQQILLAATAISVVPVLIFYLLAQKQIINGLGAGALK